MAKTTPQFKMPAPPALRSADDVHAHVEGVPAPAPQPAVQAVPASQPVAEASQDEPRSIRQKVAPRERVIVSIPPDVLADIDELAPDEGMKRSMFIVHCVVQHIRQIRLKKAAMGQ
jgi:hypothetical protein